MAGTGDAATVDSKVVKTAKALEHDGSEALHVSSSGLDKATNTLQSDWEEAQKRGPGFLREVAKQMQSDTSSIGSMNIKVDLKNNCIEFAPSSLDLSEERSSVKAVAKGAPKGLFDGTGFAVKDANDKTFYLGTKREEHAPYYNPMRPAGIGELNPGENTTGFLGGHGGKIENRTSTAVKNADGSTTYSYDGRVGADLYKGMTALRKSWAEGPVRDDIATGFKATETIGPDGKTLQAMHIKYDKPKSLTFDVPNGVNARGFECEDVTEITATRRANGEYQAKINFSPPYAPADMKDLQLISRIDKSGHVFELRIAPAEKEQKLEIPEALKGRYFLRPSDDQ